MEREFCYGIIPCRKGGEGWELFLVRHRKGDYWGFPKGHQDAGESSRQTAERELEEEANLKITRYLTTQTLEEKYSFLRGDREIEKQVIYFVAEVEGIPQALTDDVIEGQWVNLAKVPETLTFDVARSLV